MQKVLRKRVWRDLKENKFRYLALGMLITLGMYLIVSLVGAAETIIRGTDKKALENHLEDGEFGVFVPLTEDEEDSLRSKGITLEKMFYLDFSMEEGSIIRVFKNRMDINLVNLDKGNLAEAMDEVVLEKRYCEVHNISLGDSIEIAGNNYKVTGISTVPDYDAMYRNLSDSTVESSQFGLAFVSDESYDDLRDSGKSDKSEEYNYSYCLNGKLSYEQLKEKLKDLRFSADEVEDKYFKEYWQETAGQKEELEAGIRKLTEGSEELSSGLSELENNNGSINKGAGQILNSYLKEANTALSAYGLTEKLTEDNFEEILKTMGDGSDNSFLKLKLTSIIDELKELKAYKDGTLEYTAGVTEAAKGSVQLSESMEKLQDTMDELMDGYFKEEPSNLTFLLKASENPRIKAAAGDQVINKIGGLVAGVIVMILFTYVISVFVIHGIEQESSVIGALYALGAKKKDLMVHYLLLPVMVTFVAAALGTLIGFSKIGVTYQMQDSYKYFSIPEFKVVYPAYLFIYSLVMPPLVAVAVNCLVIRKRLSRPVLALLRNERKNSSISKVDLKNMGFIGRFRIRQMLRESRTGFTLIFGMFISLLIMMLGIDCYVMCRHISVDNKADTKYEYMYTYKYPEKQVPDGGEPAVAKTLKKEIYGYNLDVTLLGIEEDNTYFDADVKKGKNHVVISSAMAEKYNLKKGDQLVLSDEEEDMDYAFKVAGVTRYSAGLYAFMDIDSMRDLMGESDDYYNVVFSDHSLDIDSGRLYATTTRNEISKASDVFSSMMMPMIYMLCGVSAIIFCVVMYLMMKVMIDRAAFSISLIKIFGFRSREVRKLYMDGNFYIVALGALICIPLSKKLMDLMYPLLISNVACGMNTRFTWQLYLGIYLTVIVLYLIINKLLVRRLNKIVPAEVLKNRE